MNRQNAITWIGLALLGAGWALDLHFDVRGRDVFSWMDPEQYYAFAVGVLDGRERIGGFEVASIFPFLLMPLLVSGPSIPAALSIGLPATLLLLVCLPGLCRELGLRTQPALVAAAVLSSPLLLGLSRSLYVEYTLTALVAAAFWLWLRFLRSGSRGAGVAFGALFALGFAAKMTFPLFFAAPVGVVLWERTRARGVRGAFEVLEVTAAPLALVLLVQALWFPGAIAYYASLGNTAIPVMARVGPLDWASWDSLAYYPGEIARTLLWLLTPLLLLALRSERRGPLWLWALPPLVLLALQPVKEPRHVAPCVVPLVLLVVTGIEALPRRALRWGATGGLLLLAGAQYAAVAARAVETPYFLDRSLHWQEIREVVGTPGYTGSVALVGFGANEALALTWQLFPAVTVDLRTLVGARVDAPERFEDVFLLAAFDTYNRRSGWRHYLQPLDERIAIENADFTIVGPRADALIALDTQQLLTSIPSGDGSIRIVGRRGPRSPYRVIHAERFLARRPAPAPEERRIAEAELLRVALLDGDEAKAHALVRADPELARGAGALRNLHWIAGYAPVLDEARRRLAALRVSD